MTPAERIAALEEALGALLETVDGLAERVAALETPRIDRLKAGHQALVERIKAQRRSA